MRMAQGADTLLLLLFVQQHFAFLQNDARSEVARNNKQRDSQGDLPFVLAQKGQCVCAIAHSQIADTEVPNHARQGDRQGEAYQRYFEHSGSKHEKLERRRRRQHRGGENSTEAIALNPITYGMTVLADSPVKNCFATFASDEKEQDTTDQRTEGGHARVER